MRNETIDGIGSFHGGEYNEVTINGISKLKKPLTAKSLSVDGIFKSKGIIRSDRIHIDGITRAFQDIRAKKIELDGILKLRRGSLYADEVECHGILVCNREVNADSINIDGLCSITYLFGDRVIISTKAEAERKSKIPKTLATFSNMYFGRGFSNSYSLIDKIECTHLEGHNIKSKVVYANSVVLTGYSEIEVLHCDGDIQVENTCRIGKIVGKENSVKEQVDMTNSSVKKILDMYKEEKINAQEAETMLNALGVENPTGGNPDTPWKDDGKLRVVAYIGKKLIKRGSAGDYNISVNIEGDVRDVECQGSVNCNDVKGSIKASGSVTCNNVYGGITCSGGVRCNQVSGSVVASGGVHFENR